MTRAKAPSNPSERDSLRAIEALHRRDVKASKARDFETLKSLLDDDVVILMPGGNAIRGREAVDNLYEEWGRAYRDVEVLSYEMDFEEVVVLGDYAFEWGTMFGSELGPDGGVTEEVYHLMRILKRRADGEWKVHRAIWSRAEEESP